MSARQGRVSTCGLLLSTALALTRVWHHTSAHDRVLGKLAARIAWVLMGKHKPTYDPAVDAGDYVVVSDALKVALTGKKTTNKTYFHHTGFIGGLKEVPITRIRERRPEEIIIRAVSGMLPKNTHRSRRLARLKVYPEEAPKEMMANVMTTWRDQAGATSPAVQAPTGDQARA